MTMTMTMFGSFDALCKFSLGSPKPNPNPIPSGSSLDPAGKSREESVRKGGDNRPEKSAPAPEKAKEPRRKFQRTPRFAPELDGVHCFETIVPY